MRVPEELHMCMQDCCVHPLQPLTTLLSLFSYMLQHLARALRRHHKPQPHLTTLLARANSTAAASHYEVLGVTRTATPADIKQAFRTRAKAVHPDLNTHADRSDAEAFLRLVSAYEVLSDPEQRRLYDTQTDPSLPRVLRRAAATQQQRTTAAGGTAANSADQDTDTSLDWRWGLAEWARHGPATSIDESAAAEAAAASAAGGLQVSVLNALRRHQVTLESELHAALMTAFLGPRLDLKPGELPTALELDERSHPALTDDLLHLVHGRTLLGVVQLPATLQLTGGGASPLQLPESSSDRLLQSSPHLPASAAAAAGASNARQGSEQHAASQQQQQQQSLDCGSCTPDQGASSGRPSSQQPMAEQQTEQLSPSTQQQQRQQQQAQVGAADPSSAAGGQGQTFGGQQGPSEAPGAAAETANADTDIDAEITESEWRELLLRQHPLHGAYDWRAVPAAASPQSDAAGAARQGQAAGTEGQHVASSAPADHLTEGAVSGAGVEVGGLLPGCSSDSQQQQGEGEQEGHAEAVIGGRSARQVWEQQHEGLARAAELVGQLRPSHTHRLNEEDLAFIAAYEARDEHTGWWWLGSSASESVQQQQQQQQQQSWQQQWHSLDPHDQVQLQQQWQQEWQQQQEARERVKQQQEDERQWQQEPDSQQQQAQQHQHHQQQRDQSQQQQQQQQQRAAPRRPRAGHRRLWRWLRTPSADWGAADFNFSDDSEGVTVLRLLQEGAVSAVGVRDDTQPNKPVKVYVDGVLYACVVEDLVMQPLTGQLMAVLYRFYTPGVHHLYVYLPNTPGASRVLAKLLRRWMPPSNTWLFPPRADSHDRCSWYMESEGFNTQHRPGWMHPAVFVLTAAYYTRDIEARRLSRQPGVLQEWLGVLSGRALLGATQAWTACRQLLQRLQLV